MNANLTLQLNTATTSLDGASELGKFGDSGDETTGNEVLPFSDLLGASLTDQFEGAGGIGKSLPEDGKPLPLLKSAESVAELTDEGSVVAAETHVSLQVEIAAEVGDTTVDLALEDVPAVTNLDLQFKFANSSEALPAPISPLASSTTMKDNPLAIQQASTLPQLSPDVDSELLAQTRQLRSYPAPPIAPIPAPGTTSKATLTNNAEGLKLADDAADGVKGNSVATLTQKLSAVDMPQRSTHLPMTISQLGSSEMLRSADAATDLINTPVRSAAWGEKLGERVLLLSGSQLKTAEIRLTPADLGPLRVKVTIEDGAANVTFQANHAVTREAIEQAMPRLRELLADNGLSLGQTDVSDHGVADREHGREPTESTAQGRAGDEHDDLEIAHSAERQKTVSARGLLDTFV